ncbi:cyclophilin-like fold protein [Rathayibacter sp. VKM Ac-2754]|uniref:cyclophilin-like fold protein n=1 Tax=Rathayibacter sp. VKM Ac-2754 TaxID=2609251 RepID=UPI00135CB428|nr:cyclophilin-like fold protein [Rathayibacter sp. VKM Ac-2754]MWV58654.1 hypothetical protein [Rathayibacter sp. VKM Ac-2754]
MRADAVLVRGARLLLAPLGVLVLTVSGCSAPGDGAAEPVTSASTALAAPEPSDSAPTAAAPSAGPTALILRFGDLEIEATLDDSVAARSLLAQLPVTLDFRDYGGQEKIATLPAPLDLGTAPDRAAAPAGTLGYYAPDQGLVLYYDSVGAYPGIVPLGSFDAVEALQDASDGPVEVRVRD